MAGIQGVVIQPLPNGSGLVFSRSTVSGGADTLALYTFASGAIAPLNITTIADKCVVSSDAKTLYCGIPDNGASGTMPDDWAALRGRSRYLVAKYHSRLNYTPVLLKVKGNEKVSTSAEIIS